MLSFSSLPQCAALSEDDFYANEVLKRAVVRDFEIIGEAANMLSPQIKQTYPEIPWKQIVATRHKIIHEYFHVNYVTVWGILVNDLPTSDKEIDKILNAIT